VAFDQLGEIAMERVGRLPALFATATRSFELAAALSRHAAAGWQFLAGRFTSVIPSDETSRLRMREAGEALRTGVPD
jgi:hypothetical protein